MNKEEFQKEYEEIKDTEEEITDTDISTFVGVSLCIIYGICWMIGLFCLIEFIADWDLDGWISAIEASSDLFSKIFLLIFFLPFAVWIICIILGFIYLLINRREDEK